MRVLDKVRLRLRSLFRRGSVERELEDELRFHLDQLIEENVAEGMGPSEARRLALRQMGGVARFQEECRDMRRMNLIEDLWKDVRHAIRLLRRSPGFTAVALLTLALGIGGSTAIYSIVHAVMFRPLPYYKPDALVRIYETNPTRNVWTSHASIPNYLSWKEEVRSLELAVFQEDSPIWTGDGEPERLESVAATPSFLPVLGTDLHLGRWFLEEEQRPGQHRVAVLSEQLWKRRFGQDPGVRGRELLLDGESYTVVGVARPELAIPSMPGPDLWVPLVIDPNANRGNHQYKVIGRVRSGFTLQQAQAEMLSIARRLERHFPESNQGSSVRVVPLLHWIIPPEIRSALLVLLGAVGMVMLIACANVANLQLARAEARRKEMAIRAALGAARARILRQLLTESLLLSLVGGALGIALGGAIVGIARGALVEIVPRADKVSIDLNVLAFALAVSLVTGLLFGMAPLVQLGKMRSLDALHQAGRTSQPAARGRLQALLVVAQVSLASLLLVGAGLLIQSFVRLQQVSLGIDPDSVLTARLLLSHARYPDGREISAMLSRLTDALRSAPGVRAAGVSSAIPLGLGPHTGGRAAAVAPSDASLGQPIRCGWRVADAGFFAALCIPVLRGRVFGREDGPDGRPVFVLSQEAARRLYGAADPVGRQLELNDSVGETIGLVGDVRMQDITGPPEPIVYLPVGQGGRFGTYSLFVRTDGRPEAAANLIRERLRDIDPNQPAHGFRPMRGWVEKSSATAQIRTWVLVLLASVALAVAMVGIYGLLAYLVTVRRHELAVRLALGAHPRNLLKLVLVQGLGLATLGLAAGLAGAMLLASVLDALVFGVSSHDPATFVSVAVLLFFAALVACYVPAQRAARTDPIATLRADM